MKIYFITTLMIDGSTIKRQRTPGFFDTFEEAEKCIMENWGDIYEVGYYNYVLIETMGTGLYCVDYLNDNAWYKVTMLDEGNAYLVQKSEVPEHFKSTACFAVG